MLCTGPSIPRDPSTFKHGNKLIYVYVILVSIIMLPHYSLKIKANWHILYTTLSMHQPIQNTNLEYNKMQRGNELKHQIPTAVMLVILKINGIDINEEEEEDKESDSRL